MPLQTFKHHLAAAALLALMSAGARADAVRALPGPPTGAASVAGKDYRLHDFTAVDPKGRHLDVPAKLVDILSDGGSFDAPDPDVVPALALEISAALQPQVDLYYANGMGWMAVPRGWTLRNASAGADGAASLLFVPPAPADKSAGGAPGWLLVQNVSSCQGCMYTAADGIVAGAHKGLDGMLGQTTPPPRLDPKPDSLTHPDPCTSLIRYKSSDGLPVRAVVYLGPPAGVAALDLVENELYVALPEAQAPVADLAVANFLLNNQKCGGGPPAPNKLP